MANQKRVRLLLTSATSEIDVARIAGLLHCSLHYLRPENPTAHERIWITEDQSTFLSYLEDRAIGLRYLSLQGKDSEELAEKIKQMIPVVPLDTVYKMLEEAKSRDEWIAGIYHAAAVSSEELDSRLLNYFEKAMAHPEPDVRKAAVFAASYPGWRELRDPLEKLRDHDPDPTVRTMADMTLNALAQNVWDKE